MATRWWHNDSASKRCAQLRIILVAMIAIVAAGCASPERLSPVPSTDTTLAHPLGIPKARFYPDTQTAESMAEGRLSVEQQANGLLTVFVPSAPTPKAGSVYYLTEERVQRLDLPVAAAIKCIMRLGVGSPRFALTSDIRRR